VSEFRNLDNAAIAERLEAFATLLDLAGAGYYSARAYRRAAELIRTTKAPVAELVRAGRVRELRGIGAGIEARLRELVETGEIAELKELEREVEPELVGLGRFVGLAPKRMIEIGRRLGVRSAAELRAAAAEGRLREVPGIGASTEAKLLERLSREEPPRAARPLLLNRARALLEPIAAALGGEVAGDPRRWRDENERLAVVCAVERSKPVLDAFAALPAIVAIVERSARRAVGATVEGVPVELVVAEPLCFGTELLLATGSEAYVAGLGALPEAASEEEVYGALGLPWLPPELREAPFRGEPPPLVELADVRGDLHMHTTWSDGRASVEEMGRAARELGYEYVAICDHTTNVRVVPGLDADALRRQGEEIAAANEALAPFRILRGTECDIRADGSLDLPDDVLDRRPLHSGPGEHAALDRDRAARVGPRGRRAQHAPARRGARRAATVALCRLELPDLVKLVGRNRGDADVEDVARGELRRVQTVEEDRNAFLDGVRDARRLDGDRHHEPAGLRVLRDHGPDLRMRLHERFQKAFAVLGIPAELGDA
jgi:DNA polymerase (family 10)